MCIQTFSLAHPFRLLGLLFQHHHLWLGSFFAFVPAGVFIPFSYFSREVVTELAAFFKPSHELSSDNRELFLALEMERASYSSKLSLVLFQILKITWINRGIFSSYHLYRRFTYCWCFRFYWDSLRFHSLPLLTYFYQTIVPAATFLTKWNMHRSSLIVLSPTFTSWKNVQLNKKAVGFEGSRVFTV